MLGPTLETRRIADPVKNDFHRYFLNHHAPDPPWLLNSQGPSYPRTELQNCQNAQVWTGRAVLARNSDCREYAHLVHE